MDKFNYQLMNYAPLDGFPYYYDLVKNKDYTTLFADDTSFRLFKSIGEDKGDYKYASDKWSIKQIIGHITDHERIKIFRAFLLSRNQSVPLWGYDQNQLVENSRFEELSLNDLITDFKNVRKASISFIESLSVAQLRIVGMARQHEITLEDFLKSIIGHEIHHVNIIRDKYL